MIDDREYRLLFSTDMFEDDSFSLHNLVRQERDIESKLKKGEIVKLDSYVYRGEKRTRLIAPIGSGQQLMGYLSIIKDVSPDNEDIETVSIKQGAMVLALELMKDKIKFAIESKYRGDFLEDLLTGTFGSIEQIEIKAKFFAYDLKKHSRVIVIKIDDKSAGGRTLNDTNNLQKGIASLLRRLWPESIAAGKDNMIKLIVPVTSKKQEFMQQVNAVRDQMVRLYPSNKITLGIGKECGCPADYAKSYQEAIKALSISEVVGISNQVVWFEKLGVYSLLCEIPNPDLLREFMQLKIGPLIEHDQKRNLSLVKTLEEYLKHNGSLKEAAQELFIHVGTLKYRLLRIEELLNIDLKEVEYHFELQLAIYISHLVNHPHITTHSGI